MVRIFLSCWSQGWVKLTKKFGEVDWRRFSDLGTVLTDRYRPWFFKAGTFCRIATFAVTDFVWSRVRRLQKVYMFLMALFLNIGVELWGVWILGERVLSSIGFERFSKRWNWFQNSIQRQKENLPLSRNSGQAERNKLGRGGGIMNKGQKMSLATNIFWINLVLNNIIHWIVCLRRFARESCIYACTTKVTAPCLSFLVVLLPALLDWKFALFNISNQYTCSKSWVRPWTMPRELFHGSAMPRGKGLQGLLKWRLLLLLLVKK